MNGERTFDGASEQDLTRWLLGIAETYRWTGRQGLDRYFPGVEQRTLVAAHEQAMSDPSVRVRLERSGHDVLALTTVSPKPMETEYLGVATEAVSHVVCDPSTPDRGAVVRRLLRRVVEEAADLGSELLVLRVDADDVGALWAAQEAGFTMCEGTTTWMVDSQRPLPDLDFGDLEVRTYEGEVDGVLGDDDIAQLVATTSKWGLNHFRADPNLSDEAVDRFYAQWVPNIASGDWCDFLVTARDRGRLVAIFSEVSDRQLWSLTGTNLRCAEWVVVLDRSLGAGLAVTSATGSHVYPGGRYHSWETQVRNVRAIQCIERTRLGSPVRSAFTLHAWPQRT